MNDAVHDKQQILLLKLDTRWTQNCLLKKFGLTSDSLSW